VAAANFAISFGLVIDQKEKTKIVAAGWTPLSSISQSAV
jgi:hypothetical protein